MKKRQIFIFFMGVLSYLPTSAQVGIGTTAPLAPLHIESSDGGILIPRYTTANMPTTGLEEGELVYEFGVGLKVWKVNNLGVGDWVVLDNEEIAGEDIADDAISNDQLQSNSGGLYNGNGTISQATNVTMSQDLNFDANTLVIDASANRVGVGTSTPNSILDLGSSVGNKLALFDDAAGEDFYGFGVTAATLEFYASQQGTDAPEMILKAGSGYLGIGTTTPQAQLDIQSTTDGILIPRFANGSQPTTGQIEGEMIYVNSVGFQYWNGTVWTEITPEIADASTTVKGVVQLSGDFTGTATNPQIKANILDNANLTLGTGGLYKGNGTISQATNVTMSQDLNFDANTLVIDASANRVGVGTSTPNSTLDLGTTTGNKLALFDDAAGEDFYGFGVTAATLEFYASQQGTDAPEMVLKSGTGRLGIGTVSPATALHVFHRSITSLGQNNTGDPEAVLRLERSGTSGLTYAPAADFVLDKNIGSGAPTTDAKTSLTMRLNNTGTNSTPELDVMTLVSYGGGQVGIGTTSPQAKLDIQSTTDGILIPRFANGSQPATGQVEGEMIYVNSVGFQYWNGTAWGSITPNINDASTTAKGIVQLSGDFTGTATSPQIKANIIDNANLTLGTGGLYKGNGTISQATNVTMSQDLNFDANTFVIDASDNRVGIGTSAPDNTLHVNGTVKFENLAADGTASDDQLVITSTGELKKLAPNTTSAAYFSGRPQLNNLHSNNASAGNAFFTEIQFSLGASSNGMVLSTAHGNSTTNPGGLPSSVKSRIVVQETGVYLINVNITTFSEDDVWSSVHSNELYCSVRTGVGTNLEGGLLLVDGSVNFEYTDPTIPIGPQVVVGPKVVQLNANDVITISVWHRGKGGGVAPSIDYNRSYLSIVQIR